MTRTDAILHAARYVAQALAFHAQGAAALARIYARNAQHMLRLADELP